MNTYFFSVTATHSQAGPPETVAAAVAAAAAAAKAAKEKQAEDIKAGRIPEETEPPLMAKPVETPKPVEAKPKPQDKSRPVSSTPVSGTPWCVVWTGDSKVRSIHDGDILSLFLQSTHSFGFICNSRYQ